MAKIIETAIHRYMDGRNPSIQIRAVPRVDWLWALYRLESRSRNPSIQIRAVPSTAQTLGEYKTLKAARESQSLHPDQGSSEMG
jgi:hypothetical protein